MTKIKVRPDKYQTKAQNRLALAGYYEGVDRCGTCRHLLRRWTKRKSGEWKTSSYACKILKCNVLATGICNYFEGEEGE